MRDRFDKRESFTTADRMVMDALVHDVLSANHGRGFRFWSLFCGEEIVDQNLCIRIVELNNHDARTRVYNFASENWNGGEQEVLYMLAYRGRMRSMKQSRLTTDVRWEKRREEFTRNLRYATVEMGRYQNTEWPGDRIRIKTMRTLPGIMSGTFAVPGCR